MVRAVQNPNNPQVLDGISYYISLQKKISLTKFEKIAQAILKRYGVAETNLVERGLVQIRHTTFLKEFFDFLERDFGSLLRSGKIIRLLVIDDLSSIFQELKQQNLQQYFFQRGQYLKNLSFLLKSYCQQHNIAVLLVNHVVDPVDQENPGKNKVPSRKS